jgi:N-acetylglutamate synthase-like GNAT family acetyltransferase
MLEIRQARVSDHRTIVECVQRWWDDSRTPDQARELSLLLPKLFLQFFSSTSLVLEDGAGIKAFVVGFYAADNEDEAYIHFVGVDPTLRGQGVARKLYTAFFQRAAEAGRREVRAITSPGTPGPSRFIRPWGSPSKKAIVSSTACPYTATTTAPDKTGCASAGGSRPE